MNENMNERKARLAGKFLIAGGIATFSVGCWGLWFDIGWIAQPFYAFAWWGYILVLDGFTAVRRDNSLLTTRYRYVPALLIWSVSFWYFFELLNLRYQNWYYVGVYKNYYGRVVFSFVCFATVMIGMFESYEALTATGLWKKLRKTPTQFPVWVSYAVQLVGLTMVTLSLVFPKYLAPLVWGSVSFLLDPINYRRNSRSILRDFEVRDYGMVLRFLLAGLICGGFWESMNFFAPQKWIYTVRGLENFKLFEMPLLGFLGFPALVLDGLTVYSLLARYFFNNQSWEHPDDLGYELPQTPSFSRTVFVWSIPVQILFAILVLQGVWSVNIASERLDLSDLSLLSAPSCEALEKEGIERPIQLLRETKDPERREEIRGATGMETAQFNALLDEAGLLSFKGIGSRHGRLLQMAGIKRVDDLESQEPEELQKQLAEFAQQNQIRPPRLDMVRVWVLAAHSRGIIMKNDGNKTAGVIDARPPRPDSGWGTGS